MPVVYRTRDEHLFGDGPKRLLALDGGGIRGALTLGYLRRMEAILRERNGGDPQFRLCDYFDLIGGTSTGAIIATGLALGLSVDELSDIYRTLGEKVFADSIFRIGVIGAKFPKEPLVEALDAYLGDETLGSDKLRTGLMVVTKRLDTGSPWLLHNNPRGAFYEAVGDGVANKDLRLTSIVRASTAAPHYFDPELIEIAPETFGAFVDGGVSPYNNPAMQVLMLATCRGYGLNWEFGAERLLLVSAGTGYREISVPAREVMTMPAVRLAAESVLSIMQDANWLGQALLQWMGRSPTAWKIDSEIGDLAGDSLGGGPDFLAYLRYEVALHPHWLHDTLGVELSDQECQALCSIDRPENAVELTQLGRRAAQVQVQPAHFPAVFDI